MGHQDYFAPVHYEPPPRTPRRFPRWIIIVAFVVIAAVGLGYAALWYLGRVFSSQMKEMLPAAAVAIGQPLSWRELDRKTMANPLSAGMLGGLFVADFDGDSDQEVLAIQPHGKSSLYKADGSKSLVGISGFEFMLGGVSWDCDRDGTAEIVTGTMIGDVERGMRQGRSAEEIFLSQDLPVYDLNGRAVTRLPAVATMPGEALTADIDGDAWPELIAQKAGTGSYSNITLLAFGADGKPAGKFKFQGITSWLRAGDLDGDGQDELLVLRNRMHDLAAIGRDQEPEDLYQFSDPVQPLACVDLNGDGRAEVLYSTAFECQPGYLDCSTKQLTRLQMPATSGGSWSSVTLVGAAGKFLTETDSTIALVANMGSGVLLFDTSGQCIYYEEYGEMVWNAQVLHAGGRDYLVVQLSERLLIYP